MAEIPTWQLVVAGALARDDGRWLMHRRPAHKQHGGLWEFPGGKVEAGENPANALVRELHEELGIAVTAESLAPAAFAQTPPDHGGVAIVILLYTVTRWVGDPRALEPGAGLAWLLPGELATLNRPPLDVALTNILFPATGAAKGAETGAVGPR